MAAGGGESEWQYVCVTAGSTPDWANATSVQTTPASLTDLTSATTYDFYVRAKCSDNEFSDPVKYSFATEICDPSDQCQITVIMGAKYSFSWKDAEINIVDVATERTIATLNISGKTNRQETVNVCKGREYRIDWDLKTGTAAQCSITVIDSEGDTIYSASQNELPETGTLKTFTSCSTCTQPEIINEDHNITRNGATFNWLAGDEETQWQFICVPEGTENLNWDTATVRTTQSVTLSGLSANTSYDFYVRAYCSSDEQSKAVKYTFTTEACKQPTNVEINSITINEAAFSWFASDEETQWQFICVPEGTENLDWDTATVRTTQSVTLSGLSANTSYDFYVRTYCAINEQSTPAKYTFTTKACKQPINVETNSITDNEAIFSWSAGDEETQWQYTYAIDGEDPIWNTAILTDEFTATLSNLIASKKYNFYIKSYCSEDYQSTPVVVSFTTGCGVIDVTYNQYYENFDYPEEDDNTKYSEINNCWNTISTSSEDYPRIKYNDNGYSLQLSFASNGATSIALPKFRNDKQSGLDISLYYRTGSTNCKLYVGISPNQNSDNQFDELFTCTPTTISDFIPVKVHIPHEKTNGYIVIKRDNYSTSTFIDELTVSAAECPEITEVTASDRTHNSAKISWTSERESSSYEIIVNTTNSTEGRYTVQVSDATEYTIENLNSSTDYYVFVRSACGIDIYGEWSEFCQFRTKSSCTEPENLQISVDRMNATISWEIEGEGANDYDFILSKTEITDFTGVMPTLSLTNCTTNTHTFEDLKQGTTYYIYMRHVCGQNDNEKSEWISGGSFTTAALENCNNQSIAENNTSHSNGNNLVVKEHYKYGYTQTIYLAGEINKPNGGSIKSITYNFESVASNNYTPKWLVYIGTTNKNDFATQNDWIPFSDLTLVKTYTTPFTVAGYVKIEFDTEFKYNGTDNIVIAIANQTGSCVTSTSGSSKVYYNIASNCNLYRYNDSKENYGDPNNTTSGTIASYRPDIQFEICNKITSPNVTIEEESINNNSATISWNKVESSGYTILYDLVVSKEEMSQDELDKYTDVTNTTTTSVTLNDLTANTQYYAYVRVNCGEDGNSDWSEATSFHTKGEFKVTYNGVTNTIDVADKNVTEVKLQMNVTVTNDRKYPECQINDIIPLNGKRMKVEMALNNQEYFYFSLPFDCDDISVTADDQNVERSNSVEDALTYSDAIHRYVLLKWDESQYTQENHTNGYTPLSTGETLSKYVGYAIVIVESYNSFNAADNDPQINATATFTASNDFTQIAPASECVQINTERTDLADIYSGWNLVGNPYFSTIKGSWYSYNQYARKIVYDRGGTEAQVTNYKPDVPVFEADIKPFETLFVQQSDGQNQLTIGSPEQQNVQQAPAMLPEYITITLNDNERMLNRTTIINNATASDDFAQEEDLIADHISSYEIYTLYNNTDFAFNEMNIGEGEKVVPVGVKVMNEGDYTIALSEDLTNYNIGDIVLHDKTLNKYITLTNGESEMLHLEEGTTDNRLELIITVNETITSTNDAEEGSRFETYVHDGIATLNGIEEGATVLITDATGKTVYTARATGDRIDFEFPVRGVYMITVCGENVSTIKVVY